MNDEKTKVYEKISGEKIDVRRKIRNFATYLNFRL